MGTANHVDDPGGEPNQVGNGSEPYWAGSQTKTDRNRTARLQFYSETPNHRSPYSRSTLAIGSTCSHKVKAMKPAGDHQPPSYLSIATAFEHELPSYHKRHVHSAGGESTHPPFCDGAANAGTAWAPGAKHLLWAFHVLEERRFLQHPCKPRKAQAGRRLVAAVIQTRAGFVKGIHTRRIRSNGLPNARKRGFLKQSGKPTPLFP